MKIYRIMTPSAIIEKTVELVQGFGCDLKTKNYIFCENRATLSFEMSLCQKLGGSFNTKVLSFSRYTALNYAVGNFLSKSASTLLVRKIMVENSDKLIKLKRTSAKVSAEIFSLIAQLKSAKVTPLDLEKIINSENGEFQYKLKDIALIYSLYEKHLKDNALTDENNFLSKAPSVIANDKSIHGANVIIAGINAVTKQTLDIIFALEKFCNVSVVLLSYDGESATNEVYLKLLELIKNVEVIDDSTEYKPHALAIKDRLFDPFKIQEVGLYSDKFEILECGTVYEEAEEVAKRIKKGIILNNMRMRDFAICCPSIKEQSSIYQRVFKDYGLKLFVDAKKTMEKHPLTLLVCDLIDFRRQGFKPSFANSIAQNLVAFDSKQGIAFDDYLVNNAPSRRMIKQPFQEKVAEEVRLKIMEESNLLPKKALSKEYVSIIRTILDEFGAYSRLEKLNENLKKIGEGYLSEYSEGATKSFSKVLDEIETVLGDCEIDLAELKALIITATTATEIAIIPEYSDNVFMGDFQTARQHNSKVLFAVSMTDNVPLTKSDVSLLSDKELIKMEGYKCVIEPKLAVVNKRERENVATTLMSFEDKCFISYATTGLDGKKAHKSEVIEYIQNAFSSKDKKLKTTKIEKSSVLSRQSLPEDYLSITAGLKKFLIDINEFKERRISEIPVAVAFRALAKVKNPELFELIERFEKENKVKIVDEELKYNGELSATLLETYFSCPYKSLINREIKPKERKTGEVQANELGTLLHSVLEKFVGIAQDISFEKVEEVALKLIEEEMEKQEYSVYKNRVEYLHIFEKIKEEVVKRCKIVYEESSRTDFKLLGTEILFGSKEKYGKKPSFPAIKIKTPNGDREVEGFIDRVDYAEGYARIIDYKTGNLDGKNAPSALYFGASIQLYLYMNAIIKDYKPAGVYYYGVQDDYHASDKTEGGFLGRVVATKEVATLMDSTFKGDGQKSKDYGYDFKFDDQSILKHGKASGSYLLEDEMNAFIKYAKLVAEKGAEELAKGSVSVSPFKSSNLDACKYCKLKGLCWHDEETSLLTRKLGSVNKEVIVDAVNEKATSLKNVESPLEKVKTENGENE